MNVLVITYFLNALVMIAAPVLLAIYLINRFHFGWKLWLVGACIFIISQVFHLPFNHFVLNPFLNKLQEMFSGIPGLLIIALLLGLSAGIFEETARYFMYRWWIKDSRTWQGGILAGAGHGGIEAILLGILVLLSYMNMMAYRNLDLSSLNLALDQLEIAHQQLQAYWSAPWYATLLGALERIFTIPFHIAASVLVLQVFNRLRTHQQPGWLGLAILYHAFVDASTVFIARQWGVYTAEAVLGGQAVLAIWIIFRLRQPEPEPPALPSEPIVVKSPVSITAPIEETSDNLEKTRYQ
jgi:uncharacterized membrane protein YhfC